MTFTRVERLDCKVYRPVVLIGPLAEPLINKLTSESPDKYCRCDPGNLLILKYHKGSFILERKWKFHLIFVAPCHCLMYTVNCIIYEPIRSDVTFAFCFRSSINRPLIVGADWLHRSKRRNYNCIGAIYLQFLVEIVRASISSLEQGQESGIFVDFRQRDSHYECITVAGVQEIIDKVWTA